MPDWIPEMPAVLARVGRRERQFPRRMASCTWGPEGKQITLMTRRHYLRLQLRLIPGRVNGWLCRIPRWRRFMLEWHRPLDCICTFEDAEVYHHSSHPTSLCPLRTHCGGYDGPCGGCDDCLDAQEAYYDAKAKGLL